jgi:hypothetical protein
MKNENPILIFGNFFHSLLRALLYWKDEDLGHSTRAKTKLKIQIEG